MYHSDGDLWQVMPDLIDDIGFNALHPIEPKGMDIGELKQRIRDIAPVGGYCMGSSNSIPYYVPTQNYRAMVEATLKYGMYPISV